MFKTDVQKLRNALEFTRVYKENANDIYLREAACMDFQLRHILVPMDENDGIAGRYEHDFVGFSSQVGGIYTYYFNEHEFLNAYMACKQNGEITAAEDYALQAVQAYWHEENTARKVELEFSKRYGYVPPKAFAGAGVGNCDCRVAGTNLDFEKLIRLGFDGLNQEIDRAAEVNGASSFYTALKLWIESLRGACERYREQALELAEKAETEEAKTRFTKLAEALLNIQHSTPKTFLEGVQLMWIYAVSSDIMNYSRMDDYLGPLYAADIDAGRITEEEAVMKQIDKDAKYYHSSKGGVTFSGGEASLHFELLKKLLTACREKGYHTALETNGLISAAHLKELIPLTDLFLFDFKHSDPDALKKWAGAPLAPILESLAALEDAHAHVWLRCPVIPGVNDTDAHFEAICALKHQYTCIEKAEIMAYHDIGKTKWDALGIPYSLAALKTVSPEQKHIWETKIAD